jgi:hypothetical protein
MLDGSGIKQVAERLEVLYQAADRNSDVVNCLGILGMFRGTPQVLGEALETQLSLL